MKAFDIALKDLTRSFRSAFAIMFMFGVPLLVTGMFYFMFGSLASGGDFKLPSTTVVVADLDEGGPKFQVKTSTIPGAASARTLGELVLGVLKSKDLADLIQVSTAPDAAAARAAVDGQRAQVAIIIPADFSRQFADPYGQAVIEFYQDPTLTIGPAIMRAFLNRFMDGMAGVKITVDVFLDEASLRDQGLAGEVVQRYLDTSLINVKDPAGVLLEARKPAALPTNSASLLLRIVGPIMGGMMIFYAFFTAASSAQSILKEEEERTLPRLFTTPTPGTVVLTGKFLGVFLIVLVQIVVLLAAARLIFGIQFGEALPVGLVAAGVVLTASTFGIFVNSLMTSTRQGAVVFGGVLTMTGMIGMISVFALNSPSASTLGDTVSLLVPQGWAVRALMQAMNGRPLGEVGLTVAAMLVWSAVFFAVGAWRFSRRYA